MVRCSPSKMPPDAKVRLEGGIPLVVGKVQDQVFVSKIHTALRYILFLSVSWLSPILIKMHIKHMISSF